MSAVLTAVIVVNVAVGVGRTVVVVIAVSTVCAVGSVVVPVVHVDPLVCLIVVGGHREGGLIGVDVVSATELLGIVAGQSAVEVVVLESVAAEEGGASKEKTASR